MKEIKGNKEKKERMWIREIIGKLHLKEKQKQFREERRKKWAEKGRQTTNCG